MPTVPVHAHGAPPTHRILAAATEEFAVNGFFGARTKAIADAAGVNKAMLHYYFRTKENLYGEVIKTAFQKILTRLSEAWLVRRSMDVRIRMVVNSFMDTYAESPGFLKIILREVIEGGDRLRRAVKHLEQGAQGLRTDRGPASHVVDRIASELRVGPLEATHFMVNLVGMCVISFTSPLLLEALLDFDVSDFDGYIEQRKKSVEGVLLAYVAHIRNGSITG